MENEELHQKYSLGRHWDRHPTMYAERFASFLKSVNVRGRVLDVGCGSGRDVNVFVQNGFCAVGIDYDVREVRRARENFPCIDVHLGNAESLDFPDASIDAVFMINVVHYTNEKKSLSELLRVLKKRGYACIHFNLQIVDKDGTIDYHHDEGSILRLLADCSVVRKEVFMRVDEEPVEHTHTILELLLQKE